MEPTPQTYKSSDLRRRTGILIAGLLVSGAGEAFRGLRGLGGVLYWPRRSSYGFSLRFRHVPVTSRFPSFWKSVFALVY